MSEKKNPETLLRDGNKIQIPPTGFSMYPFLNPGHGDQVIIESCDTALLKRGDVVLYRRAGSKGKPNSQNFEGGILILHRIWKRKGNDFFMVGDNQKMIEGPIYAYQICGKMTGIIKKGKLIRASNKAYIVKSRIWLLLRPLRPFLSHLVAGMKKCGKKK